jgi:MFS family permease
MDPPAAAACPALQRLLLPAGVDPAALPLLLARGLRALGDGCMAVLLPSYLLALGLGTLQVGLVSTATLLGSALATLAVGAWGHRWPGLRLLRAAAWLIAATGLALAGLSAFWPLLAVAFVGTLNPSAGDVSVFLPLEHARLAAAAQGHARTALFARYSLVGALCAAVGALAAGLPDLLARALGLAPLVALRGMFVGYGLLGLAVWCLYRAPAGAAARIDAAGAAAAPAMAEARAAPLGASRAVVLRLALLFSVDAFAGGLLVNALMALWLLQRFGISLAQAGVFFAATGLLGAASQLAAPLLARRIGLLHTMVFTHIPANACLVLAALVPSWPLALGLLLLRAALSQMDVPTRTAFVMAVVTPAERAAAASFTAVPRSLASAISPTLSAALLAAGWLAAPLVACGLLKIGYDLALWRAMRRHGLDGT